MYNIMYTKATNHNTANAHRHNNNTNKKPQLDARID